MRASGKDDHGITRILLNGKFVFSLGTLDQGFWPDGIYTAPTDAALEFDLQQQKALGFNAVRKHIKVEPARWYYWADKLGLMVFQDMPAMKIAPPTPDAQAEFLRELHTMVDQHKSETSIPSVERSASSRRSVATVVMAAPSVIESDCMRGASEQAG